MEKLEQKVWDACLGIVKHQEFHLMIIRNFGELSVWIDDTFLSKGIGQNYN